MSASLEFRQALQEFDRAWPLLPDMERAMRYSEMAYYLLCRECIVQREPLVGDESFR